MKLRFALLLFVVFAVVNLANALHKGGDFEVFLEAGARALARQPLYEGSSPGSGVIGPPAQAMLFAPFALLARVDEPIARIVWYGLNLAALLLGLAVWARALLRVQPDTLAAAASSSPALLGLLAIALPAQTNFEHQNMSALLLLLIGAGVLECARGSAARGGMWIGIAAALKAFPALLIVYLALRRQWRACAAAVATGAVLTFSPAVWYGFAGAWLTFRQWLDINREGGWPLREQNQSLYAMAVRFAPAASSWLIVALTVALLALVVRMAWTRRQRDRGGLGTELAVTLGCAVLISPIAWDHYWVLMLPLFIGVAAAGSADPRQRTAFWIAAILVTGLSPLTLGAHGFGVVRWLSASTVAALVLVAVQKKGPHEAGL